MERTTISRRLGSLERSLGVKLLDRSSRQTMTTDAGRKCFEKCVSLLEIAKSVDSVSSNIVADLESRPITIAAPPDLFDQYLSIVLHEFDLAHPEIEVYRQPISELSERDLALVDVLVSWSPPPKSVGLVRKLAAVEQSIYSSPNAIGRYGYPKSPHDLKALPCIVVGTRGKKAVWQFWSGDNWIRISVDGRRFAPNLLIAREAAIAGFGVCQLPNYLGDPFVQYGRLVKMLPNFRTSTRALVTVSSRESIGRPRVALLRLFLEGAF